MDKHIFVSDLDGTLLGADSLVSRESVEMLNRAARLGAQFTVATARTPATVEPLLERIETKIPAVVLTGAALWDFNTHSYISCIMLGRDEAVQVGEIVGRLGLTPMVYKLESESVLDLYHPRRIDNPFERRFIQERTGLKYKRVTAVDSVEPMLRSPRTVLVLAMGKEEAVMRAVDLLRSAPNADAMSVSCYTDAVYPDVWFLEVFGPGVDKAHGLQRLRSHTGARHLTVFGDNYNDLPMMAEADCSVAVENGVEAVRRAATRVIGPNTTDSVARYILEHACCSAGE